MMGTSIVVGVDGSASADEAVRWAALTAQREGRDLAIVHAFGTPNNGYAPGLVIPQDVIDAISDDATTIVDKAAGVASAVAPKLSVTTKTFNGSAAAVLRDLSTQVAAIVLGSRGRGGIAGALLGSVSTDVAAHAHCSVTVVKGPGSAGGPVVVGVDCSPVSEAAVAEAFAQADARKASLVAVHTYTDLAADELYSYGMGETQMQRLADEAGESLSERLAGFTQDYPDVPVEKIVVADGPAQRIIDLAKSAQLVVLGSRGRGGFRGLLLGSTSQKVMHEATCPVEIIKGAVTPH